MPEPGNPQTLNRYSYVNNNPTTLTDPSGHVPVSVHDGGGGFPAGYTSLADRVDEVKRRCRTRLQAYTERLLAQRLHHAVPIVGSL